MGGQCYISGSARMSERAMAHLLARESEVRELLHQAADEGTLYYSHEDGQVMLDGVYVSWEADSVIDHIADNKDMQGIDVVEWTGEGLDGPLSDILVYFVGRGRWVAKAPKRPRLSSRERAWLLGREA